MLAGFLGACGGVRFCRSVVSGRGYRCVQWRRLRKLLVIGGCCITVVRAERSMCVALLPSLDDGAVYR